MARLAGVPPKVLNSAKKVLFSLEKFKASLSQSMLGGQLLLFDAETEGESEAEFQKEALLTEDLASMDPMNMTPMEALEKLCDRAFGEGKEIRRYRLRDAKIKIFTN